MLDNRDTLAMILALLLTAGCSASGGPEQPLPDALWPAAIVAAIEPMAAQQARPTRVDPNPAALPSARRLPVWRRYSGAYHKGIEREVEWLQARITGLGLEPIRVLTARRNCDHFRAPPQVRRLEDCPGENETVLLFDIPKEREHSLWTVDVMVMYFRSGGAGWEPYRVELRLDGDGFRFLRSVSLVPF